MLGGESVKCQLLFCQVSLCIDNILSSVFSLIHHLDVCVFYSALARHLCFISFTSLNCSSKDPDPGWKDAAGLLEFARGGVGGKLARVPAVPRLARLPDTGLDPIMLGLGSAALELGER